MSDLTPEIREQVEQKLKSLVEFAETHFNYSRGMPTLKYDVRGRVAGYAYVNENLIRFNRTLLVENVDKFIEQTVPHEFAHLVDYYLHPSNFDRGVGQRKRSIHGPTWKRIMMAFGANPSRCHSYDTSRSRRRTRAYRWTCSECGNVMDLGPKRHRNMINFENFYNPTVCRNHRDHAVYVYTDNDIKFMRSLKNTMDKRKERYYSTAASTATSPKRTKISFTIDKQSKLQKCRMIMKMNHTRFSRKEMISAFVTNADCTPAGAATYYAKLKKEFANG